MNKTYVLYHKNCTDGFGAAYAAWLKLKDEAIYIPVGYEDEMPILEPHSLVYLIDFCYSEEEIIKLNETHQLIILDHHITAEKTVKKAKNFRFDLKKSGASLSWEFFHGTENLSPEFEEKYKLIKHIEDKDLWLFKLPETRQIIAALESYPREIEIWHNLKLEDLKNQGIAILQKQKQEVEFICGFAYMKKIQGYEVPVLNSVCFMSDAADHLLKIYPDHPFVGVYYEYRKKDGSMMRKWSFRSRPNQFDVAQIAKNLGGGGHITASGYLEKIGEKNE